MANSTVGYDYLVVGAGLFGATFANKMAQAGKSCLVIDKAPHVAGNCYTENRDGIDIHMHGPHIFHTSNLKVWEYVNQYARFIPYKHTGFAKVGNTLYSLPINLATINKIWPAVDTPAKAEQLLADVRLNIKSPDNFEDVALNTIGRTLYDLLIKGYTKKQWGRDPKDLPASIFKRLPVRTSLDNNYYFDTYQGIPANGYTALVAAMLDGIPVLTNTNFLYNRAVLASMAKKVVYTGPIDEYYNYTYGHLDYRSLRFAHHRMGIKDYQGHSIINYPEENVPYTRVTEHKHFTGVNTNVTWVTYEQPLDGKDGPPYYPINDTVNNARYSNYRILANKEKTVLFGGRLAEYKYYDMDQVIKSAFNMVDGELKYGN